MHREKDRDRQTEKDTNRYTHTRMLGSLDLIAFDWIGKKAQILSAGSGQYVYQEWAWVECPAIQASYRHKNVTA